MQIVAHRVLLTFLRYFHFAYFYIRIIPVATKKKIHSFGDQIIFNDVVDEIYFVNWESFARNWINVDVQILVPLHLNSSFLRIVVALLWHKLESK